MDLVLYIACGIVTVLVLAWVALCLSTTPLAKTIVYESENFFTDVQTGEKQPFPSLFDRASLELSVVVPAYNEEIRLPVMLEECLLFLEKRSSSNKQRSYEVIIVDDGSKDRTTQVAMTYSQKYGSDKVRVLTLAKNRGKGGAVRLGMLRARGKRLLFADADGASKFEDIEKLETRLVEVIQGQEDGGTVAAIVCGSRAHLEEESIATRSYFRTLLMYGFHTLVWLFAVRSIRDTQCGFKLLSREAARMCFPSLHIERWAFDVELLFIAEKLSIPIEEVAIRWTEIEGTKMVPVLSWIEMGKDLIFIWVRYTTRAWRIREHTKSD
nr:EOG090X0BIY [Triops cancriformis]